jgi:hypothetical protein
MRFTSLILVAAFALPLSGFASTKTVDPADSANTNSAVSGNFNKLEALFNGGLIPSFAGPGLVGFAGRCFVATQESAVKGAAYLSYNDDTRNGPIDCGRNTMSIWSDDLTHYDGLSARSAIQGGTWSPTSIVNGSLATVLDRNTGSFLRQNGNYYIEKIADPSGQFASYYCYYYLTMAP